MAEGINWALSECACMRDFVCVCRVIWLVSVGVHRNSKFRLTPALNSEHWTPSKQLIVRLLTGPFVALAVGCLSLSKLVCVANRFCFCPSVTNYFSAVHDTRVMAKERQKKDNHNLSKCLSLAHSSPSKNAFMAAEGSRNHFFWFCFLSWKKAKIQHQLQD